jgi:hypothetical protein
MPKGIAKGSENDPPGLHLALAIAIRVLDGQQVPEARRIAAKRRLVEDLDGRKRWGREHKRKIRERGAEGR